MTIELLQNWWNLIFILPFGLGLAYLGMYTLSGWTFGDADLHSDVGADHGPDLHADIDSDVSLDHDADLSHDVHLDADSDAHSATHADQSAQGIQASPLMSVLNWIGIGRAPMSLVLMILMMCWGVLGFASNQLQIARPVASTVAVSIAVAGVGSSLITHFVSSVLAKLFTPMNLARRRHQLLGSVAEAMYPIDDKFGMVHGRDDRGEVFQVACRTEIGQPPVAKGTRVQLVAYSAALRMFTVQEKQVV